MTFLSWFRTEDHVKANQESLRLGGYDGLRYSGKPLLHVEDILNNDQIYGTDYHGEFRFRLAIYKLSKKEYVAQEALESSGRALFLTQEIFNNPPNVFLRSHKFKTFDEACEWLRRSESISQGQIGRLFEKEVVRITSTKASAASDRTSGITTHTIDLFLVELPENTPDTLIALLEGIKDLSDRWAFPHSMGDLRYSVRSDIKEYAKITEAPDPETLISQGEILLLPLIEDRFIKILDGQE